MEKNETLCFLMRWESGPNVVASSIVREKERERGKERERVSEKKITPNDNHNQPQPQKTNLFHPKYHILIRIGEKKLQE